jgi:hypothetical protein
MENYGVNQGLDGSSNLVRVADRLSTIPTKDLSLVAFEETICLSYKMKQCAWVNEPIMQLCAYKELDQMSYDAARTFSMGVMAYDHHSSSLQFRAGSIYQALLVELSKRLQRVRREELAALIVPVMAMTGYEVSLQLRRTSRRHTDCYTANLRETCRAAFTSGWPR